MTTMIDESIRNGIDTAVLSATAGVMAVAPDTAQFRFRAADEWVDGTHGRSTVGGFYGIGQDRPRDHTFELDADHPAVLVGRDNGPTPVEYVLHALVSCLTAGIAMTAARRGVRLTDIRSTVDGNLDLAGVLGLNPAVRNGFEGITVRFAVKGDAPDDVLADIVEHACRRSAVFDIVANPVPVTVEVEPA